MQVEMIPWEQWLPDANNARGRPSPEELAELAASIAAHDIRIPLVGYRVPEGVLICDGHRRWQAAKQTGKRALPGIVFPTKPDEGALLLAQLVINGQRSDLNPVERYEAYVRLARLKGWSASELAAGLSVKPAKVSSVLALGKLTADERELVRQGKISESAAYALARMPPEQRTPLVAKAAAGEVTRDQLSAQARRPRKADSPKRQRVICETKGGRITVQSADGLTLTGLIELLDDLIRRCRTARSDGLDILTAVRVFRDRARTQPANSSLHQPGPGAMS